MTTITIDPLTRIEGHGRITITLGPDGSVADARFHVTQFRGFEKLCEGRPFSEMPSLMARICGICPVSHLIASAKACDEILAVRIPEPAVKLRKLLNLAQIVQSHALSFFYLSAPDLVLGMDAPPGERNVFGLLKEHEPFVRDGVRLRQFGQTMIEELAGKRIHPAWVVPGGVNEPLDVDRRDRILARIPEALSIVRRTLERGKAALEKHREEIRTFANFPSHFLGLVDEKGMLEHTDGKLRLVDAHGKIVADGIDPRRYRDHIGEAVEPDSYLKSPYWRSMGYPDGMYRVGPLARLNVADGCGTPLADQEWAEFRNLERGAILSSFHYHQARLIEILHGLEKIERLLLDPDILSLHVRAVARANNLDGVGVSEAPRGLLIHHYRIDDDGLVKWADLVIATGHNNLAMNRGVLQVARHFLSGRTITEGLLNRVEAVIRAFDPCLSCSTHALGKMPLAVDLVEEDGTLVDRRVRG